MPLSGVTLGAAIAAAGAVVVPPGPATVVAMATALCTWVKDNAVILPGTLTAAGSAVSGAGLITFPSGSGNDLGDALAASIPSADVAGIAKWRLMGNAVFNHLTSQGQITGTSMVASPTGGPVTGNGGTAFSGVFSPLLGVAMALTGANIAVWTAIGVAIDAHFVSSGSTLTLGLASPSGGGTLTGATTFE